MKIKDLEIAIINLLRNEDRRKQINFLPNSFVEAYDGKFLTDEYLNNELVKYTGHTFYIPYNHKITEKWKCKMACMLSHIKTLTQFSKPLLILEDDFFLTPPTKNIKDIIINDVPNDWDIIFLGGFFKVKKGKEFKPKDGLNKINTKLIKFYTTHSYIVRKPKKLLESFKNTIPRTYDIYLNNNIFNKQNCYFYYPSLIVQNPNFDSEIDNSNPYRHFTF